MRQTVIKSLVLGLALLFGSSISAVTPQSHQNSSFPLKVRKTRGLSSALKKGETFTPVRNASSKILSVDGTILYGDVVYSDNWASSNSYGVYSLPVSSNAELSSVHIDNNFKSNAGAVYVNGLYHILNANFSSNDAFQSVSYFQYDTNTWEENDENEFSDSRFMAADMTVNPLTNVVYGAFSDGANGQQLATFDFTSKGYVVKGALSKQLFAIAADAEGTLYGIGSDNILYKVDKNTAKLTKIGSTGIKAAAYLQSATFDWTSGKLYWATTLTNDVAGLYEVDVTTGKASLISYFPNNEEIVGLYCTNKLATDDAPAAVGSLKAEFEGASTIGAISFVMPTKTNGGDVLNGNLNYVIKINGEKVAEGNAVAGETVDVTNVKVDGGNTEIVVLASNANGSGMPSKLTVWTGYDIPTAPTNVKVSYLDGKAHIGWSQPTASVHGGYLDKENMTYTVTRYPDHVVLKSGIREMEYIDEFKPAQLAAYYYAVTAITDGMESEEAKSNSFVAGEAVIPPYYQSFDDATSFQLMTVIDGNGDGTKWKMSADNGYAEIRYADEPSDDWLITPQIKLTNNRLWKFSCRLNTPWAPNWPEKLCVSFGKSATAEAMTGVIQCDTTFNTKELHTIEKYFKVDENGNYNIGIHAGSLELYKIQLDSILVEAGPLFAAPAAVENLSVKADAKGKLATYITFCTPTKTVNGKALASISKVEVYRDDKLIHTFNNPSVGTQLSFTDNQPQETFNRYKIVAYNESGFGYDVTTNVYVGEDIPLAPENVKVSAENGKATITWKAPVVGVNGGYVDSAHLVYGIKDNTGNVLTATAEGTSYQTDMETDGEQAYLMYAVFAGNSKGYSTSGISNAIIKGASYELPFNETFDDDSQGYFWGSTAPEDSYSSWSTKGGCARLDGGRTGSEARLFSGKIDLSGAENPVLEFYYWYRSNGSKEPLCVDIISDGKDTTTVLKLESTSYTYAKDYQLVRVPISQFKGKKYVQVSFNCKSGDNYTLASIDDIRVRDYYDYDLTASVSAPTEAKAGESIDITAKIKNVGKNLATNYVVKLYEGENIVDTQDGIDVKADSTATYTFRQTVGPLKDSLDYKVVVSYDLDGDLTNNESEIAKVGVSLSEYPTPGTLSATESGHGIDLAWTPADYVNYTLTTVDGAEDYAEFADDKIGEWITLDEDGLDILSKIRVDRVDTYPVSFPQLGKKASFIVMNPVSADAQLTNFMGDPTGWQPASGKQYFASFGSDEGASDDWLISPELNGEAQTISFKIHGYKRESYEVLYSTTDKNPESFITLGTQKAPATTWTSVNFELPEGAKYFAIRNVSAQYSSYIFVDDISFRAAKDRGTLSLLGYNIYRDGEKLNTTPVTTASFTDLASVIGNHIYQVTAVYTIGESASTSCEVNIATGITKTELNDLHVMSVYGVGGMKVGKDSKGVRIMKMSNGTTKKVIKR